MKNLIIIVIVTCISVFTISCQVKEDDRSNTDFKPNNPLLKNHQCQDPRPQICTREFRPVCAQRDLGIRCVTSPCPTIERVTKPNACVACSDKSVQEFTQGACPRTSP